MFETFMRFGGKNVDGFLRYKDWQINDEDSLENQFFDWIRVRWFKFPQNQTLAVKVAA